MPEPVGPWVVYLMPLSRSRPLDTRRAMCAQSEWDAMELADPGFHTLVQGGIASEQDAELLARGASGDRPLRLTKPRA